MKNPEDEITFCPACGEEMDDFFTGSDFIFDCPNCDYRGEE